MSFEPHEFWQAFSPPGTHDSNPTDGYLGLYPAPLADGRQLALPIRVLPGDGKSAVASLILNEFLYIDLDEAEIGPETMVRWIRT